MEKYHKIQSIYKRDPETNHKTFLDDFSRPEIEYLAGLKWEWTEKVDGMNMRIIWTRENPDNIIIKGRSDNASIPGDLIEHINNLVKPEQFNLQFADCEQVCLYGEGYGGSIQKAGETYGLEKRFVMFDVKVGDVWLDREAVMDVSNKLSIPIVPVVGYGSLYIAEIKVKLEFKSQWGDFEAEGIVARPPVELQNKRGERIITKIKCCDYAA